MKQVSNDSPPYLLDCLYCCPDTPPNLTSWRLIDFDVSFFGLNNITLCLFTID